LTGYYIHHWFGSSTGINDDIEAGGFGSAGLSHQFERSKIKEALFLQVENVWNVPYRVIERRPMPGRTFTAGIKLSI
jgi:hypothetical protein